MNSWTLCVRRVRERHDEISDGWLTWKHFVSTEKLWHMFEVERGIWCCACWKSGHQSKYIESLCANISQMFGASHRGFTQFSTFPSSPMYLSFIDLAVNTRWINDDIHQVDGVRVPYPTPKKWLNTPVRFRKYAVECQISGRTRVSTWRRPVQSNIQCV